MNGQRKSKKKETFGEIILGAVLGKMSVKCLWVFREIIKNNITK